MSALRATPASLYAGDVSPSDAWAALQSDKNAVLVDVRTPAEWTFAGMPDLLTLGKETIALSWKHYPNFDLNPQFLEQLKKSAPDLSAPIYFLCKTGGRSTDAAIAATAAGYARAYNIAGGFEGDMNNQRQRGTTSGWKAAGLPWQQA